MDVERSLLTKVVQTGEIQALFEANITRRFFQDDEHVPVAKWLYDFWDKYGDCPGVEALKHDHPKWQTADVPAPIGYYVDKLREDRRYFILQDTLEEALESHKEEDNDATIKALSGGLEFLNTEVNSLADEDYTQTCAERMEYYMNLAKHKGLIGITTGFPTLDNELGGYQKGQLITWIGPPKSGKSTMVLRSAVAAHEVKNKPAFVSFEMSNREQEARADVMRAKISYKRLLHGQLLPDETKRLQAVHKVLEGGHPMWFIHDPGSTSTVSMLRAKVQQYRPDILFVDGVYLMDAEIDAPPGSPQALTYLTRSFKRLAQDLDIPVIISTQVLTWKMSKKKALTQETIGYSSSFAQDSDVIIGVQPSLEDGVTDTVLVSIVDARSAARRRMTVRFDWDEGEISELEAEVGEEAKSAAADD